ncbi:hypothetical protein STCU_08820 [Strigomonas culicis]|uniref:Vacuolar protein sorting-associated protein 54 N-terminal domain-containing protein n=1 Tax=Strigomonas culicis TaxID=28005 RepID=S9TR21_9TRYP|nr:hypothetical protein STCU_08820 [Strigomonas culicis]|eukprot:EPY20812.1 hypothetical protein STCU_08820 [Strigomonas culicis]
MDEVSDSLATAWKQAMRGMKSGYNKTKSALKPTMDKLAKSAVNPSHGDIRRMFQLRYGAEVRNEEGERMAAAEASDVESSDEEPLTDEQVQERVDKKFFDKSYDAARYELSHMEATYTDSEEEGKKERAAAEVKILDLRQKCDIVSTTLKKRVLLHHTAFMSGIEKIRLVNDSLYQTSNDCKKARKGVRRSTASVVSQISLLAQQRARCNVKETLSLIEAMNRMVWKKNQLLALIHSGKMVEASQLLKSEGTIDMESAISRVYCMKSVIAEWREYQSDPKRLKKDIDLVITNCLTVKFIPTTYRNAFESAQPIGDPAATCSLIAQLLWQSAIQILTKSLAEVSYIKSESAPITDIAEGIHPDHLLLCVCQMAAKLMDFLYLFANVVRIHEEESRRGSGFAPLHRQVVQQISGIGRKIGRDLVEKLDLVLSHARLAAVDVDRVLHIFVVVSMLVEALSVLGLDKAELASARTQVKAVLLRYMQASVQTPKAKEVMCFMGEDTWRQSDVSASTLNVVRPLSPDVYRKLIKEVKNYLAATDGDSYAGNPFYLPKMLQPQDMSSLIETELFSQYFAAVKEMGLSASEQGASLQGNVLPSTSTPTSPDVALRKGVATLVEKAQLPPTTTTSSVLGVTNAFLEYEARLAVRFPPLAADILSWCEDLIGVYVYTVADSFVSVSRSVPIENQGDLSPSAQRHLTQMHTAALRALNAPNGSFAPSQHLSMAAASAPAGEGALVKFPPKVWGAIRADFGSEARQYALGSRAVACDSCITLLFFYEATIKTMAPLLPSTVVEDYLQRCKGMYRTAVELLHVCIHRLCLALYPMANVIHDISKLKPKKDEIIVSSYVRDIVSGMQALNTRRIAMPTPSLENLFIQRFIFSVQYVLVQEYCKLAKKKLSDTFIMQLQVDAQTFQQLIASAFGRESIVCSDYILGLVKTGFYADDKGQQMSWLKVQHQLYPSADLLAWLSGGDRAYKMQLEDLLSKQLRHEDVIPIDKFVQGFVL